MHFLISLTFQDGSYRRRWTSQWHPGIWLLHWTWRIQGGRGRLTDSSQLLGQLTLLMLLSLCFSRLPRPKNRKAWPWAVSKIGQILKSEIKVNNWLNGLTFDFWQNTFKETNLADLALLTAKLYTWFSKNRFCKITPINLKLTIRHPIFRSRCTSCRTTALAISNSTITHQPDLTGPGTQSSGTRILIWPTSRKLTPPNIGSSEFTGGLNRPDQFGHV